MVTANREWSSDSALLDLRALRRKRSGADRVPFTDVDTFEGVASDPITLHKYMYGNGDPVNGIDPSGMFTVTERLVVGGAMLGILSMGARSFNGLIRSTSSSYVPAGEFVPVSASRLESHYHSVRIAGSRLSADAMLGEMQKFSSLNMYPVRADRNAGNVGDVITFDMQSGLTDLAGLRNEAGQADFPVKVTKFNSSGRYFVVRTMSGHPLAGWRYWGVRQLAGGDLVLETFSVEHPYSPIDWGKMKRGGLRGMYLTWENMLTDLAVKSGGSVVVGPDTDLKGREEPQNALPRFHLVQ